MPDEQQNPTGPFFSLDDLARLRNGEMSDEEIEEHEASLERFAAEDAPTDKHEKPKFTKSDLDNLVEDRLMSPEEAARLRPNAPDDE